MRRCLLLGCFAAFLANANPAIDMEGYLRVSREAAKHRETRRLSEQEFIRMSRERILIYCNNNFENALGPFPGKLPSASLNLSTYIALYNYGYRNVYELGPLIDIKASRLEFESSPRR